MSFREEDKEREKSGHGAGWAVAAAIGVGVGAAVYYLMKKATETPAAAGSTAQGWTCESPHTLFGNEEPINVSDDSYTTLSEHSTSDTSILEDSYSCKCINNNDSDNESFESDDTNETDSHNSSQISTDNYTSTSDDESATDSDESDMDTFNTYTSSNESSDSDLSEWDITRTLDYPAHDANPLTANFIRNYTRNLLMSQRKEMSRERSWSLEECSICFDVILRDQEIMSLPCTHHFHSKCILPWLQEKQTCPNCRKSID